MATQADKNLTQSRADHGPLTGVALRYEDGTIEEIDITKYFAVCWTWQPIDAKMETARGGVCKWKDPPGVWDCG